MSDRYVSPTLKKYLTILVRDSVFFGRAVRKLRRKCGIKIGDDGKVPFFRIASLNSFINVEDGVSSLIEKFNFPDDSRIRNVLRDYLQFNQLPVMPYESCINSLGEDGETYNFKAKGPGIIINLLALPTSRDLAKILKSIVDRHAEVNVLRKPNLNTVIKEEGEKFLNDQLEKEKKLDPFLVKLRSKASIPKRWPLIDIYLEIYKLRNKRSKDKKSKKLKKTSFSIVRQSIIDNSSKFACLKSGGVSYEDSSIRKMYGKMRLLYNKLSLEYRG